MKPVPQKYVPRFLLFVEIRGPKNKNKNKIKLTKNRGEREK
jgi:hypothetical protein